MENMLSAKQNKINSAERTTHTSFFSPVVQAKLTINKPGDPYEQEADAVADKIMRMPGKAVVDPLFFKPAISSIQRKCTHCEQEEKQQLQRKEVNNVEATQNNELHTYVGNLPNSGRPLSKEDRRFFEPKFGYDFSNVRLHTDSVAAKSAQSINALAYTSGNNIVFNNGQYSPGTNEGKRLLGHELTHVVQQQNNIGNNIQRFECSATRSCAPEEKCSQPDNKENGKDTPSTWYTLTVNVDTEESSWESALRNGHLGHTHIRFSESNGRQYTYGFYPANEIPNENKRYVEGCVNHPDTAHDACTDRAITFVLKKEQYDSALGFARDMCRKRHYYGIQSGKSYTCTTFAAEVAGAAGQALPSSSSEPTTIYMQQVPSIDNPNTLKENMEAGKTGVGDSDTEIRDFVNNRTEAVLSVFPRQEKIRWITRLLTGWISDDDMAAIEKICKSATGSSELNRIHREVEPLLQSMSNPVQEARVHRALSGAS